MRGVPDHSNERPCVPPGTLGAHTHPGHAPERHRRPWPSWGGNVLERVPRPERGALEAYRLAANALSRMLRAGGVRMKPKDLYYTGLRLKWMADNPTD